MKRKGLTLIEVIVFLAFLAVAVIAAFYILRRRHVAAALETPAPFEAVHDYEGPVLATDSQTYAPGSPIALTYSGIPAPKTNDWLALYQVGAANTAYGQWCFLNGRSTDTLSFTAPNVPGRYHFRLFLDWPSGGYNHVQVSPQLVVAPDKRPGQADAVPDGTALLELEKTTVMPGEPVRCRFNAPASCKANAWIGIIPASVPHGDETVNDQFDRVYEYLNGRRTGLVTFSAPDQPGEYDVRLHDTDSSGVELASATFHVTACSHEIDGDWIDADGRHYLVRRVLNDVWLTSAAWAGAPALIAHARFERKDEGSLQFAEWPENATDLEPQVEAGHAGVQPLRAGAGMLTVESESKLVVAFGPAATAPRTLVRPPAP